MRTKRKRAQSRRDQTLPPVQWQEFIEINPKF